MHAGWNAKQLVMQLHVVEEDVLKCLPPKLIAGTDISFDQGDSGRGVCTVAVCDTKNKVLYEDSDLVHCRVPYVPGFLGFREAPAIVELLERLKGGPFEPDIVLVDGNGLLHPRRCGVATQIGVQANLPTIGCAKSFYAIDGLDEFQIQDRAAKELKAPGEFFFLDGRSGRRWGAAMLTGNSTKKPIYISVGHRVSLETAVEIVRRTCLYRVPEPVRQADMISRRKLKQYG